MNRLPRGFSIIESVCMLAAIIVFALICLAIYKKQPDFFGANSELRPSMGGPVSHQIESAGQHRILI